MPNWGSQFGVSRQTIRQAFRDLVAGGSVYRVPGRGSFAVASPDGAKYLRAPVSVDDLLALAVDTEMEVVDVAAAGRPRLETDEVAASVFWRFGHDEPFSITSTCLPLDLAKRAANDPRVAERGWASSATIISLLEESGEAPLAGDHQSVSAARLELRRSAR